MKTHGPGIVYHERECAYMHHVSGTEDAAGGLVTQMATLMIFMAQVLSLARCHRIIELPSKWTLWPDLANAWFGANHNRHCLSGLKTILAVMEND